MIMHHVYPLLQPAASFQANPRGSGGPGYIVMQVVQWKEGQVLLVQAR